jgi:hypothetical protein
METETREIVVLKPRRAKFLAFSCFSMAFCLGGILMIRHAIPQGWLVASFSGLGVQVFMVTLIAKPGCVTIDEQGFTLRGAFRSDRYRWCDVQGFGVGTIAGNRMVVFNCSPEFQLLKRARAAAAAMTGFECALSNIYGIPVEELADFMNRYKANYDSRC